MRVLLILYSCASMGADELITELVLVECAVQITVYAYRMIQSIKPQLCTHVTNEITQCSGCHNQAIPYAVATSFFNDHNYIYMYTVAWETLVRRVLAHPPYSIALARTIIIYIQ